MLEQTFTITAPKGIHLQPATALFKLATKYPQLNIRLVKEGQEVSATSVMSILSLELSHGSTVTLRLEQENKTALKKLKAILEGSI